MLHKLLKKENLEKTENNKRVKHHFFLLFCFFLPYLSYSQCAMCRAALEGEGNIAQAKAINDGIVYLMIIPYLLVIIAAFAIYRIMRKRKQF
jgi:membrane protein DedA with SNARE-associated domain